MDKAQKLVEKALAAKKRGDTRAAERLLLKVTKRNANHLDAHYLYGTFRAEQGDLKTGLRFLRRAAEINPSSQYIHANLGTVYLKLNDYASAAKHFQRALKLEPNLVPVLINLGNLWLREGQIVEAVSLYQRALEHAPNEFAVWHNLGNAYKDQGLIEKALDCLDRALALHPDDRAAQSCRLMTLNYHPHLTAEQVWIAHRDWGRSVSAEQTFHAPGCSPPSVKGRRIRVGYLSADLKSHPVAHFFEPLLRHHDRERFEVRCYAQVPAPDAVTERLQAEAEHWTFVPTLDDRALAQRILGDGIDILVELGGHSAENRIRTLVSRPAPVQMTWLGYPNTTGLPQIDYRITDADADPVGVADDRNSERLLRLERCFLCYQPASDSPEVGPLPMASNGYLTFGSFNNLAKVSSHTIRLWARVLESVPGSKMLLKSKALRDAYVREQLLARFASENIGENQLDVRGWTSTHQEHLSLMAKTDLVLDTFPYTGTTTTCEALWMGVPVVTLAGDRHVARVGKSLLRTVGLDGLVAESEDEYVDIAVQYASDVGRLEGLRRELRSKVASSTLVDSEGFAREIERLYEDALGIPR